MSRDKRENTFPLRESVTALSRFTLDHLLWPAMGEEKLKGRRAEGLKKKWAANWRQF
jgi:hypothetical protein